jgi:hypothetical protein
VIGVLHGVTMCLQERYHQEQSWSHQNLQREKEGGGGTQTQVEVGGWKWVLWEGTAILLQRWQWK